MTFKARLTRNAKADLSRRFGFLLERELSRDGGDLTLPTQAIAALRTGIAPLKSLPFTCRKAGQSPFLRERVVPGGAIAGILRFSKVSCADGVSGTPSARR